VTARQLVEILPTVMDTGFGIRAVCFFSEIKSEVTFANTRVVAIKTKGGQARRVQGGL
jgi:hypothetical protein